MRVLLVCNWFLKYAVEQAVGLRSAGADVGLLCRDRTDEFAGSEAELARYLVRARDNGVETFVVPGRISDVRALPAVFDAARRARAWGPLLVHAHDNEDPRLLLATAGHRVLLTVHDPTPHPGSRSAGRGQEWVRRRWLAHAHALHVHGTALVPLMKERRPDKPIFVVPHGAAVRERPLEPPTTPTILLFGRLEPYKGIPVLLEAMQTVWRRRPDARLVIAGEGSLPPGLAAEPRVDVRKGYVPEGELDALFAGARLAVLPYVEASASGVGALAIGRGVPAVVTATGTLAELAVDQRFVAAPGDPASLAGALLEHLEHGEDLRERVLERARSLFSWEAVGKTMIDVYHRVLELPR